MSGGDGLAPPRVTPQVTPSPLRLRLDTQALQQNWRALARMSGGAACGAAVKADGYGLGAPKVAARLGRAGCCDFFVSNWREAEELAPLGLQVSVFHGVRGEDMPAALAGFARPVLNTPDQVARWREAGGGPCDAMVDTGMNRLGLSVEEVRAGLLDGLRVETLMSHLACAEDESPMNRRQRDALAGLAGRTAARRLSLTNSAGLALGPDYRFDLTRPGLSLYGGVPRPEMGAHLRPVIRPEAQVIQRRRVPMGESVGYDATWVAASATEVAILNIGYADGYLRAFSDRGAAEWRGEKLPAIGRVSMDLIAVNADHAPGLREGDWVGIAFDLPTQSAASGLSQYELLTGLGSRYDRLWS